MDITFFENQSYYSKTDIHGENRTQEHLFWEIETMIESQTHKSVIVHNLNPISPTPSLLLQTTKFVNTESSTLLYLNQS